MNLIIVESPTKARTLTRYLKGKYTVESTFGHIRDLPKSELGVDTEHKFTPTYVIPKDRQKRVGELRTLAAKASAIILATDPDREGEAIAFHVAEILAESRKAGKQESKRGVKKAAVPVDQSSRFTLHASRFSRIVFHEITESAISDALAHPRTIDMQLVDAQQARRILDRLVGYKLSPLLWQKLSKRWLSAGRVQSVAVRLIVEREREIENFTKEEFWTIEGLFSCKGSTLAEARVDPSREEIHAQLVSKDGVKYEKILTYNLFDGTYTTTSSTLNDEHSTKDVIADFIPPFTVSAVEKKEVKRFPPPPFTTSTLQQDAGRRFYFSAKKTMQVAQKLYEEGFITYHRTDSVHIAEKFMTDARDFIKKAYGAAYVPNIPRRYETKSKVAQEAHEAIRPTDVRTQNVELRTQGELNRDHLRLYELIWKRALASQASEAMFDSTTIKITSSNGYLFQTQGSVILFDGFLRITGRENGDVFVPSVEVGEQLTLREAVPTQHFTTPPPRYTEAALVKTLEEKGIGRPSTYAPIISTIQERQYVTKEEKKLIPTQLGNAVTDFLVRYFPEIMDLPFTAKLEDSLDSIANGQKEWVPVIAEFYTPFSKTLEATYLSAQKVKVVEETLEEKCPACASPLVVRMGRYGKFVACSTFPKCSYTRQFVEKIDKTCPRCGGDVVIKKSRRGKTFYGCSNYPTCTFAAWKKEDIK